MKLFHKEKLSDGRRNIYFCGIKVLSYRKNYPEFIESPSIFDIDIKKFNALIAQKTQVETIILGSSHARDGYLPDERSFNLGLSSQDLYRSYKLYEWLCKNDFTKLKNIILFYDVFSPGFQLEKTCEAYKCIPYKYFYNIPYVCPIDKTYSKFEKLSYEYFENNFIDATNYHGESFRNVVHDSNMSVKCLVEKHLKNNKRNNNQTKYIEKIILLARKYSHNVFIILPPYRKDYLSFLPPKEDIFGDLLRLVDKYNTVSLLDFHDDKDFNINDFDDFDHLSETGAVKLTEKINNLSINKRGEK